MHSFHKDWLPVNHKDGCPKDHRAPVAAGFFPLQPWDLLGLVRVKGTALLSDFCNVSEKQSSLVVKDTVFVVEINTGLSEERGKWI